MLPANAQATVSLKVFGISFTELVLILVVALVVLGPQRLPGMLRTMGLWIHKIRTLSTEVRAQTGIDDLLRQEGIAGGLAEVRALLRGEPRFLTQPLESPLEQQAIRDPYASITTIDASRERPVEGPDAYGALPDDLVDDGLFVAAASTPTSAGDEAPPSDPALPEKGPDPSADTDSDDATSSADAGLVRP